MRNEALVWDRLAGIYDIFIRKDRQAYQILANQIGNAVQQKDHLLEIATGTGILALAIAPCVRKIEAIDVSPKMIAKARHKAQRTPCCSVQFSVQDACALPYAANSFDAVILSNALHIMPHPEKALAEAKRVLKPEGQLFAPTFIHAKSKKAALFSALTSCMGFRAYSQWSDESYKAFLMANGLTITEFMVLHASFPLAYCRCTPSS